MVTQKWKWDDVCVLSLLFSVLCLLCSVFWWVGDGCSTRPSTAHQDIAQAFKLVWPGFNNCWVIYHPWKGCVARPCESMVFPVFWQTVSRHLCLQANGSAKKAGGDCKPTFPSLPASKIPALSPSSGKSSSLPSSSGDNSNFPNPSATKPSVTSNPLSPQTGRSAPSASLIPSVSNGSLKFQSPTHTGKGHHLSFSLQTQNGRAALPSASSSSPTSPASPTSLNQGAKSIRTIHTPSLTSYKAQNGSSSKTAPSTAKETA